MTNVPTTTSNYRAIGDTTQAVYEAEFARTQSPMLPTASATWAAARPHSALFLAQAFLENQYETTGHIIKPHHHNPVSLRPWPDDPRGMPPGATGTITASDSGQFLVFASDAACAREWRRRLFDDPEYKAGIYRNAVTLEQMLNIFAPPGDVHPVTGIDNANIGYAKTVHTMLTKFAALEAAPEEEPPMATHKYIISGGHRNTNRGGANNEINWTYPSTLAIRDAIKARGGEAWIVQEEDGDGDKTFFLNGGLQQAAAKCVALAAKHGPFDAYISSHYNGGASPGFHVIFPDARSGVDTKANNPTDVKLCRTIRDRVKKTNTVRMLSWTADSPGVMSEKETGVGAQGHRLGEFVGTLGFRDTTARVILEASSIDVASERTYINDPRWVRSVYAEAIVDALEDVFGRFRAETEPIPAPPPDPGYAKPIRIPELDVFRERPDDAVPIAIQTKQGPFWLIGRDVTVVTPTQRNQMPAEDSEPVGPDLVAGERFYAWFGSVNATGQLFTYTKWGTIVWLDDTDMGVAA